MFSIREAHETTLRHFIAHLAFSATVALVMLGILHIYPARCDFQTERCLKILTDDPAADSSMTAFSVGPGGDFGNLADAIYRLRRARLAETHLAHAWCECGLAAAAGAGFSKIIFSPQGPISRDWLPWVGAILRRWDVEIVCPSLCSKDFYIAQGARPDRCQVIPPAVDMSRLGWRDPNLRKKLGLSETDYVLLAPGESTREAAHKLSLWSAAILNVLDPQWRLLIWGRGTAVDSLERFVESTKRGNLLVNARKLLGESITFEALTSAADAAMDFASGMSAVLPLEICMAAGLPIVASVSSPDSRQFLRDKVNAVVELNGTPRILAQRMISLRKNEPLRARIGAAARAEASTLFSIDRNLQQWRDVYARLGRSRAENDRIFTQDKLVENRSMHYI